MQKIPIDVKICMDLGNSFTNHWSCKEYLAPLDLIVKYIIKNNLVDVHDTGNWPQRPLDIAYFFNYNDMIAYLNKAIFKNGRTCYGSGEIENNKDLNGAFYYKPDNKD